MREVGDRPRGGDASDRAVAGVREPEGTVGARGDPARNDDGWVVEDRDRARWRDASDRAVEGSGRRIGEPEVAVGAGSDGFGELDPGAGEVAHDAAGRDASDQALALDDVHRGVGEPEGAVRSRRDGDRLIDWLRREP